MIAGQLEIQLMANMARLVSDMDNAKRTVGSTVDTMNKVLGTIGVGVSFAGIAAMVKGVADVGDKLNDLRKITGLTVNELGGLDKMAKLNGTDLDAVAKAIGIMSKNMSAGERVFNLMGITVKDTNGKLRDSNQVFLEIAEKFSRYQDGAAKSALAAELFGKSGRDLIPLLSEGRTKLEEAAEAHRKYSGFTNESAELADKFNDEMTILQGRVSGVKNRFVNDLLPTLTDITGAFVGATNKVNEFSFSGNVLGPVLKSLAHAGYLVFDTFNGIARSIGGAIAQAAALVSLDYQRYIDIGNEIDRLNAESRASYDDFVDSLYNGDKALQEATASQAALNDQQKLQPPTLEKIAGAQKETVTEAQRFIDALQKEARETGVTGTALTRLRAQYLGVSDAAGVYIDEIERKNRAQRLEEMATQDIVKGLERYKKLNDETKTALEKYQDQVQYINEARNATDGTAISQETYNRALQKAQEEFDKTRDTGKSALNELDQYAVQAARNIQTSLANFLFDPFNDGLKGMVTGTLNAVRRLAAEFTALRIAQGLGLQQLFDGLAGSAAGSAAGTAAGGSSTLSTALSLGNIGSSALSLFRGGFGANSLVGGALSLMPGNIGAFGSGLAGDAMGGLISGGFSSSAASAASMGASLAAISGPLLAAFAATQGLKMLAGNKRLGGTFGNIMNTIGDIPIIGDMIPIIPIINGLFGRGPLKQKETQLTGDVGLDGLLSAYLTTNFKAKGGLLVGSKRDFAGVNLLTGVAETDNKKLQGIADGMLPYATNLSNTLKSSVLEITTQIKTVSDALNISLDPLKDFRHQINLISESGKALTDEQITGEITSIGDDIVTKLVPSIRDLSKNGETALQTFSRLGNEFTTLSNAASLILKLTSSDARAFISGSTYQGRTAFIDAAGGIDALSQKVSFFAQNFLTSAEQLAPVNEHVNAELAKLGLSTNITKDQFRDLVQSFGQVNGISEKTLQALLALAPAFVQVRDQAKSLMSEAFTGLQSAVESERTKITRQYNSNLTDVNAHIDDITQSIGKLSNLSDALKATVSDIFPVTRDAAKRQIQDAIASARSGGMLPDADSLRGALGVLGKIDPGSYGSALDYAREQARTANLVADLGKLTDGQLTVEQRSLSALIDQRTALTTGFEQETARLDGLLTQGQAQIDALNGIKTNIVPLSDALAKFNSAIVSAGGVAGSGSAMAGTESAYNPNITPQQIRDFVATPGITEMDIYNKARDSGVGFGQYAAATGSNIVDLYAWADAHGLPRFASGGFHRGGLRIVGENGPELEYTPPSRIFNNADARSIINPQQNKDLIDAIKELKDQLIRVEANTRAGAVHGSTTAGILKRVTPDGDKIATGTA